MNKFLIIDTGGTFNKIYNPLNGQLEIDKTNQALLSISKAWMIDFTIVNIIGKDSLDMTHEDRVVIAKTIKNSKFTNIIIIHGTDTMDKTADFLKKEGFDKKIILTGAMIPYSINPIEATANFTSAYGYLNSIKRSGIYISMNGVIELSENIIKNREKGKFEEKK